MVTVGRVSKSPDIDRPNVVVALSSVRQRRIHIHLLGEKAAIHRAKVTLYIAAGHPVVRIKIGRGLTVANARKETILQESISANGDPGQVIVETGEARLSVLVGPMTESIDPCGVPVRLAVGQIGVRALNVRPQAVHTFDKSLRVVGSHVEGGGRGRIIQGWG